MITPREIQETVEVVENLSAWRNVGEVSAKAAEPTQTQRLVVNCVALDRLPSSVSPSRPDGGHAGDDGHGGHFGSNPRQRGEQEGFMLIGQIVEFQDEGTGTITDETVDSIYIVSEFFTGWMFKAEYFDLLGIP